jgi:phosphoribosyl 1,2-cyclic phosphate phosphodiesterase
MIGCTCRVCRSDDPRDKRLRVSALIEYAGSNILIDTSADFRQQMLGLDVRNLDAILYTHSHYDHISGFDDLRAFQFLAKKSPMCYAARDTFSYIRRTFPYAFGDAPQAGGGLPNIPFTVIEQEPFELHGLTVTPIPVLHGRLNVLGFRIGPFAYLTDCSAVPEASIALLAGLDTLVLDGLRFKQHPTHLSIAESVELAKRIKPGITYLTHMNHDVMHADTERDLPPTVRLGYDGLRLSFSL